MATGGGDLQGPFRMLPAPDLREVGIHGIDRDPPPPSKVGRIQVPLRCSHTSMRCCAGVIAKGSGNGWKRVGSGSGEGSLSGGTECRQSDPVPVAEPQAPPGPNGMHGMRWRSVLPSVRIRPRSEHLRTEHPRSMVNRPLRAPSMV